MTNSLGDAWAEEADLGEHERQALYSAAIALTDTYFDELPLDDFEHSTLGEMLPRAYATRYTAAFGRQFFATLSAVVFKLAQSEMMQLESSVAEAIALQVLIDEARATMEEAAQQPSFGGLEDAAFQDLDHLYLWDPQGKSEPGIGEISGDLAFARWFTP